MTVLFVGSVFVCPMRVSATASATLGFGSFASICTFLELIASGYTVAEAVDLANGDRLPDVGGVSFTPEEEAQFAEEWAKTKAGFTSACKKAWDALADGADYTGKAVSKAINKVLHSTDADAAYRTVATSKAHADYMSSSPVGTVAKWRSFNYANDYTSKEYWGEGALSITPGFRVAGYIHRSGYYDFLRIVTHPGDWSKGLSVTQYVMFYDSDDAFRESKTWTSGTPEFNVASSFYEVGFLPTVDYNFLDFPIYPTYTDAYNYVNGNTTDIPVTDVPTSAAASGATDIPDNPYKTRGVDADVAGEWTGVADVAAVIDDAIAKNPGLDIVDVMDLVITVPRDETQEGEDETDKPIVVPDVPALRPEEDFEIGTAIVSKFPFCVPFDLIKAVQTLSSDPVVPDFDVKIKIPSLKQTYSIKIDFNQFETMAVVSRWFFRLLFILSLILITRKLIKG